MKKLIQRRLNIKKIIFFILLSMGGYAQTFDCEKLALEGAELVNQRYHSNKNHSFSRSLYEDFKKEVFINVNYGSSQRLTVEFGHKSQFLNGIIIVFKDQSVLKLTNSGYFKETKSLYYWDYLSDAQSDYYNISKLRKKEISKIAFYTQTERIIVDISKDEEQYIKDGLNCYYKTFLKRKYLIEKKEV